MAVVLNRLHSPPSPTFLLGHSPSSQSPSFTSYGYAFPHIPRLIHLRAVRFQPSPISCSRRTEHQDDLSTSASDISDVDISRTTPSIICSEKTKQDERFVSSVRNVALWVSAAVAFGIGLGFKEGGEKATEFFTGYILEQSLSVDNLFVFVLIFKYFKVPSMYQNQVLSYGIVGAVVFRLTIILLGTATLQRFESVNLLLAGILLFSSFKLFATEEDDTDLSDNFIVKSCQRVIPVTASYNGNRFFTAQDGVWKATPLLLTVAVIELSDIAFAVDSIPAVFGCTRDPFIVYTSNVFAILGLRSLYTLISEGMSDLVYLQPSIGVVLSFIGCKMILDFFGFHISTEISLGFVATSLSAGVVLSLLKKTE
ncbi:thylakoid membrane protein TERC, chloroplastic isoform X2 [Humulus lupulus]|uniref:thylakoid membrane protein TERC, chloroplastic isoform X2 n=1 Tax=Humulus lupulus TaxID=3486 RepID=UPI002B40A2CF|nr:thylakoid membrane protein TERC, chloroplastic isoform X2 [Humulus lupulus]